MRFFGQITFLVPAILFVVHQLLERFAHIHISLVDNHMDPLLCPIILLSFYLFQWRHLIFKDPTYRLPFLDVIIATIFLAIVSEELFPLLSPHFTADIYDYFAFFVGGTYFYFTINQSSK